MDEIDKILNDFETKYKEGFTKEELNKLISFFPNINIKAFNNSLMGNTGPIINDEFLIYKHDAQLALRCGLENRDRTFTEFD